jgi:hypothetical protein
MVGTSTQFRHHKVLIRNRTHGLVDYGSRWSMAREPRLVPVAVRTAAAIDAAVDHERSG